jgi:hypothetical protein
VKGVSKFVEFVITIALSVLLLTVVGSLLFSYYSTTLQENIRRELRDVGLLVSNSILRLYESSKNSKLFPNLNQSILLSSLKLELPERVSNRRYEVVIVSKLGIWGILESLEIDNQSVITIYEPGKVLILARTLENPEIEVKVEVPNIEAYLQGRTQGGETYLYYYRHNFNSTIYDRILLGQQDFWVEIEEVS